MQWPQYELASEQCAVMHWLQYFQGQQINCDQRKRGRYELQSDGWRLRRDFMSFSASCVACNLGRERVAWRVSGRPGCVDACVIPICYPNNGI